MRKYVVRTSSFKRTFVDLVDALKCAKDETKKLNDGYELSVSEYRGESFAGYHLVEITQKVYRSIHRWS